MNPFSVKKEEYEQNFAEKKNFLKSLIFLIFKGDAEPTKIEDNIIDQTLVEYYDAFFHPFTKYTAEERERLRERLMLEDKMNGKFQEYEDKLEEKYGKDYTIDELEEKEREGKQDKLDEKDSAAANADVDMEFTFSPEEKRHHERIARRVEKLRQLLNDGAASEDCSQPSDYAFDAGTYRRKVSCPYRQEDRPHGAATQEIACAETQFQQLL